MKRLIIYLIVWMVTFSIGITVELILTANRRAAYAPTAQEIKPAPLNVSEPSAQYSVTPPASDLIFDYDPKEFNPRGVYYISGRKPKAFREFDSIGLAVDEINGMASGSITIETYANQSYTPYHDVSGLVTKDRLTFATTPFSEGDFEYSFDGRFLRGGVLSDAGKNRAVLKGKLSKSKRGVKIAECELEFRIEYLGC